MDYLNASLKLWINLGVGNNEWFISVNQVYEILGNSSSKALPCFHALTGCDYTPALLRKDKLRPFKLLEQSEQYQLACQNIITDDEELVDETCKILEKLICHIYRARDSCHVNDVRFHLFSKTYRSKKSDDNFEKKFRYFDPSSLPPCKAELYQHLLRVRYVTKIWSKKVQFK